MADCAAELCHHWAGSGCVCAALDLTPEVVCGHRDCGDGPCIYDDNETGDHGA